MENASNIAPSGTLAQSTPPTSATTTSASKRRRGRPKTFDFRVLPAIVRGNAVPNIQLSRALVGLVEGRL